MKVGLDKKDKIRWTYKNVFTNLDHEGFLPIIDYRLNVSLVGPFKVAYSYNIEVHSHGFLFGPKTLSLSSSIAYIYLFIYVFHYHNDYDNPKVALRHCAFLKMLRLSIT